MFLIVVFLIKKACKAGAGSADVKRVRGAERKWKNRLERGALEAPGGAPLLDPAFFLFQSNRRSTLTHGQSQRNKNTH